MMSSVSLTACCAASLSSKRGRQLWLANRFRAVLGRTGELIPASPQEARRTEKLLVRAGFRRPEALKALRGLKLIFPVVLLAAVLTSGAYRINPVFMVGGAVMAGFMLPEMWL